MENNGADEYIICAVCKCKFINDEESIKNHFGYNRLNKRWKTCYKCKERNQKHRQNKLTQEVDVNHKCCSECYHIKPLSEYGEYMGVVVIDRKCHNQLLTYTRCIECRNKDKERRWGR